MCYNSLLYFTDIVKAKYCKLLQMYNFYPRWSSKRNKSVILLLIYFLILLTPDWNCNNRSLSGSENIFLLSHRLNGFFLLYWCTMDQSLFSKHFIRWWSTLFLVKGTGNKKRNETNFLFSAKIAQNTTSHAKGRQSTEGKVTQHLFSLKHAHIIQLSPEGNVNSGVDIPKVYI